ncbi:MAG: hypothetical protein N0A24_06815 [Armatimonadetes bacterium]|nr:hypothetical protein [Armatimonadota bacterium]MDW8153914.1 hypothetical protein [Armatimonadota bacterium]
MDGRRAPGPAPPGGLPLTAAERATDRLHGFAATMPDEWRVRIKPYGLLLSDFEGFLLVRGAPKAAPAQVVAPFVAEARGCPGAQPACTSRRSRAACCWWPRG